MIRGLLLTLFCVLFLSPQALAQDIKTFGIAPFAVHGPQDYQYLQQGIASMLQTRLTWPGHFRPVAKEMLKTHAPSPLASAKAAQQGLQAMQADYLVYGSLTIMGKECSLDVHLIDAQGTATPFASQTTLDQLIPSLETTARHINAKVFKRPEEQPVQATRQVNQMNPNLVFNQSHADHKAVLNPQFRYQGSSHQYGKWQSQSLSHESRGMVIIDADNDGTNEIFILDKRKVYAYAVKEHRLVPLDTFEGPSTAKYLNINALDVNGDGYAEIFIAAVEGKDEDVCSTILTFKNNTFHQEEKRNKFLFNVVKLPPDYRATLLGQRKGHTRLFERHVYELVRMSGTYTKGKRLTLPPKANVFNIAFLPKGNDYNLIVADNDHLITYSSSEDVQAVTEEVYAASAVKLEHLNVMPGMGGNRHDRDIAYHFLPTRLLPVNLDQDEQYELIVARPISIAAQFFSNFKNFSQGEIHALKWDGIGLHTLWKTRRIKGTLVDYMVADIDNDTNKDLVICVQTYPGATGFRAKRTIVMVYPLDQSQPTQTP